MSLSRSQLTLTVLGLVCVVVVSYLVGMSLSNQVVTKDGSEEPVVVSPPDPKAEAAVERAVSAATDYASRFREETIGEPNKPAKADAAKASQSPPTGESDEEWAKLPRHGPSLYVWLVNGRPDETARPLFRHRELNPGDGYIAKADRDALDQIISRYRTLLTQLRDTKDKAVSNGMIKLVESGAIPPIPASEFAKPKKTGSASSVETAAEQARAEWRAKLGVSERETRTLVIPPARESDAKKQVFHHVRGDVVYRATLDQIPAAMSAQRGRLYVLMELADMVTAFFNSKTLLGGNARAKMLAEINDELTKNM